MLIPALAVALVTTAVPGHFDQPQDGFAQPWTTLRDSNPYWANLDPEPINAALRQLRDFQKPQANGKPLFAGAVTMYVHNGKIVTHDRTGYAVLYEDQQTQLPEEDRVPDAEGHDLRPRLDLQALHVDRGDPAGRAGQDRHR